MKEKEGANIIGGGLRRETWIHPGDGRRVRRTTSAATANEARLSHSDLEELSQLTSVEVCIPLVTSYLSNSFRMLPRLSAVGDRTTRASLTRNIRKTLPETFARRVCFPLTISINIHDKHSRWPRSQRISNWRVR